MAQNSVPSCHLDSLRARLPRAARLARKGLALFLTWVLVFQAVYGANTTEAIAEGLESLGEQLAATTEAQQGSTADAQADADAPSEDAETDGQPVTTAETPAPRTQPIDWTQRTDALVLSSAGLAPDYANTSLEGAVAGPDASSATLPASLAANLNLTLDLDATRGDTSDTSAVVLAGDSFSLELPGRLELRDESAPVPLYALDDDGNPTSTKVAEARLEGGKLLVSIASDAAPGTEQGSTLKAVATIPVSVPTERLTDDGQQLVWTLQEPQGADARTATLAVPSRSEVATGLGLIKHTDPEEPHVPGEPQTTIAPSADRSAEASPFVTAWADNGSTDRPSAESLEGRREYRLYFQVEGDDTRYPLTTDGRTVSADAQRLLGLTQEGLDEIRLSAASDYGSDPELVSVDATGTNEYTAHSAAGLPTGVVTTTVTPGTDADGKPTSTTTTTTRALTWSIKHEVAGTEQTPLEDGALIYDSQSGEPTYVSLSNGTVGAESAPFERECLASVSKASLNVVLNLGPGAETFESLQDWMGMQLADGSQLFDHQHIIVNKGGSAYRTLTGQDMTAILASGKATFATPAGQRQNTYALELYLPKYAPDQQALDFYFSQDTIENSNVDGYRDYYQVWYTNEGSVDYGRDAKASMNGGTMTVTHAGNTSFSATKVWLDDDPSARPATTYTLWRYSDKDGQSSLTASQVQFDDGEFVSLTMSAEQNAALGSVEHAGPNGIPQNNVTLDIASALRERYPNLQIPKYDQDGCPYVYFVREQMDGGQYEQTFGTVDAEGNVEEGSDAQPGYWDASRSQRVTATDSSTTRPQGDTPIYDGGTVTNIRTSIQPTSVTKTWDAAAYQDQLKDVTVTLKCQRILKRHAHETSPGVWMPNYDPMYDDEGNQIGSYEWTDFEPGPGETYPIQELTGWTAENNSQTITGNYDKYDEHGEEYVYRWVEVNVEQDGMGFYMPSDDYTKGLFFLDLTSPDGQTDSVTFVSNLDPATGTITNRYANTTDHAVDKLWAQVDENGNVLTDEQGNTLWSQDEHPYGEGTDVGSVSVRLIRDGELIGDFTLDGKADEDATALHNPDGSAMMGDDIDFWEFDVYSTPSTAQETSPWHLEFTNLPKFAPDGHKYSYQVLEDGKAGYASSHTYDADSRTTTLYNTPADATGESSSVRVSKQWLDAGNNTARPTVRVGLYARHDMSNKAGTVSYKAGDLVATAELNDANEWYQQLTIPIGGLGEDDFEPRELSTEADGTDPFSDVAAGETRMVTKEQAEQLAAQGSEDYQALLSSWTGDGDRMLTSGYAYEVSYGHSDVTDSIMVTNRRVGVSRLEVEKDWVDVGASEQDRPQASFRVSNKEGKVTFSYSEDGELLANVDGLDPMPVNGEQEVSRSSDWSSTRLDDTNTALADDGHTLVLSIPRTEGTSHDSFTIDGLPKYDASGEILRWSVSESWEGDAGDYVSSQTGYEESYGGDASPWHHADLMQYSFANRRSASTDVTFHTRWYDHYVQDTLDQRMDIYLTLYRRVRVYDDEGNPALDESGEPLYRVEAVPGYQHYEWSGVGEAGEDPLYSQYATVSGLPRYDEHGAQIVYYASVHHSQSESTVRNLDYADPWFTYGASADDADNAGYPGSRDWDEATADNPYKAQAPSKVEVDDEDPAADGDSGFAVREDGTFNFRLERAINTAGEKIWLNLPTDFSSDDLPGVSFYLQRRVAGGHYAQDGSWVAGGNDWSELSVTPGSTKGSYSVLSYDSTGKPDYAVADGKTAVAWTSDLTHVRGNRYAFTITNYGENGMDGSGERALPAYDRNGRPYEYRVREIVDGLIQKTEDGSDVPGGFDVDDLAGGKTPDGAVSGIYTVRYGTTGTFNVQNAHTDGAKGRLTVKKLFCGLEPGDKLPDCTFALYRYYVKADGSASASQLVTTKTMSLAGCVADASGRFMRLMEFDDLDVYTPAGGYWVYFVAEQPINGYEQGVAAGDPTYGSSAFKTMLNGADTLADGSLRTPDSATVTPTEEGAATYLQPTGSVVADDHTVDFSFENSYYGSSSSFGELSGTKQWYDQNNVSGARPDHVDLTVTRRYASGVPDATNGGVVELQEGDPNAPNYLSWNKTAGTNTWSYVISNLETIAPDGTYWLYEVHEKDPGDDGDYRLNAEENGGEADMARYDGTSPVGVGRITNYLRTKVGFTKHWEGDAADAWRQRPAVYVRLQARVRADGGDWGAWDDAGATFERAFGVTLARKRPFGDFSCPEGTVLPGGQNTVNRITADHTSADRRYDNVWKDLPATGVVGGQACDIEYRVVECRLVYDKYGQQKVVDIDAPDENGTYGTYAPYQPSQTEGGWVKGDTYVHSTITNTLAETTSLTVSKTWDDSENAWATRPGTAAAADAWSATYVLQRRVAGGDWSWLSRYGTTVSSPFSASGELNGSLLTASVSGRGASSSATFGNLPARAQTGEAYEYRAVELVLGSYDVDGGEVVAASADGARHLVAVDAGTPASFTNKLRTLELIGTKTWNDWGSGAADGLTPESCGIELKLQRSTDGGKTWAAVLLADGSSPAPTWSVAGGTWTYRFDGLPEADQQGHAYTYRAVERDGSVAGFFADKTAGASGTAADGSITNVATRLTFDKAGDGSTGSASSLNGAAFSLRRNGAEVATWERDESGAVTTTVGGAVQTGAAAGYIVCLPAGTYEVAETRTPDGYVAASPFTITIGADGTVSATGASVVSGDGQAVAPERGNAVVRVTNSVFRAHVSLSKFFRHNGMPTNSTAVAGMTFDLYRADGTLLARGITTGEDGTWTSRNSSVPYERDASGASVLGPLYEQLADGLPQGGYYLRETGSSALTQQSSAEYRFEVTAAQQGKTVAVSAENAEFNASVHLAKADAETGAAVDGAVFELRYTPEGSEQERSLGRFQTGRAYAMNAEMTRAETDLAGESGQLAIAGLKKGTYRLVEAEDEGYELGSDRPALVWTITERDEGADIDLADDEHVWQDALTENGALVNYPKHGSLSFTKLDGDGGGLNGATFTLQRKASDGTWEDLPGQLVSGRSYEASVTRGGVDSLDDRGDASAAGKIEIGNLPWGTYRLVETSAPEGYVGKTDAGWPTSAEATIDRANVAASANKPIDLGSIANHKATFAIRKTSWAGKDALCGARFSVRRADGQLLLDGTSAKYLTTDEQGIARPDAPSAESHGMSNELAGVLEVNTRYVITETTAPAGFATPDPASFTVKLGEDGTLVPDDVASDAWSVSTADGLSTVTVRDKAINLRVRKLDEDGNPLAGAEFSVTGRFSTGQDTRQLTATSDGSVLLCPDDMIEGETYVLSETQPPVGYTRLADLTFVAKNADNGEVRLVPVGDLPAGWSVSDDGTEAVAADSPVEFLVKKTDEGGAPLSNADFDIEGLFVDGGTVTRDTYWGLTPENGLVRSVNCIAAGTRVEVKNADGTTTSEVADGIYTISERYAPFGFEASSSSVRVRVAEDGSMTLLDAAPGWSLDADAFTLCLADVPIHLDFAKVANDTSRPLEGAEFTIDGVFADGAGGLVNNGEVQRLEGLSVSDLSALRFVQGERYNLTETRAPAGYELIGGTASFEVAADGTITKFSSSAKGGSYGVSPNRLTLTARDLPIELTITKTDGSGAPLAGARFSVSPTDGGAFADGSTEPLELVTDARGVARLDGATKGASLSALLVSGQTYALCETGAPAGYQKVVGEWRFSVSSDGTVSGLGDSVSNGSVSVGAAGDAIAVTDIAVPFALAKRDAQTSAALAGAVFEVAPEEGSAFANAEALAAAGVLDGDAARLVTDAGGTCGQPLVGQLVVGNSYAIREVTAPAGYTLLPGTLVVTVEPDGTLRCDMPDAPIGYELGEDGELVAFSGNVFDEATELGLTKRDAQNALVALDGARFSLAPAAGFTFADGSTDAREVETGADGAAHGCASFERALLRADDTSVYELRETRAPDGYSLRSQVVRFRVRTDGTLVPVSEQGGGTYAELTEEGRAALASEGYELSGETALILATDGPVDVTLRKTSEDGSPLAGATFTITPADGANDYGEPNRFADGSSTDVRELEVGEAGLLLSRELVVGNTYELEETVAPDGYALNGGRVLVHVNEDGTLAVAPVDEGTPATSEAEVPAAEATCAYEVGEDGVTLTLADPATHLRVAKRASDGAPVSAMVGARFSVEGRFAGATESQARLLEVGADGQTLALDGLLVAGEHYTIREVSAPAGYQLLTGALEVVVRSDGAIVSTGDVAGWTFSRGEDGVYTATATDDPVPSEPAAPSAPTGTRKVMPQTGDDAPATLMAYVAAAGLALLALGLRRRRHA